MNFQDQDQLIERMNEINRTKNECEGKLKQIEQEKKKLENELKKKKKEFHRVMQRTISMRKKGKENMTLVDCAMLIFPFLQAPPTFHPVISNEQPLTVIQAPSQEPTGVKM